MSLSKYLVDLIRTTGPVSVSTYMRHALVHPLGGYYTTKQSIHSGLSSSKASGDFITSPEISQIFVRRSLLITQGELMALWVIVQYRQNPYKKVQLVELGPGRGTLMSDMLRVSLFPYT